MIVLCLIYAFNLKTFFGSDLSLTALVYFFSFFAVIHFSLIQNSNFIQKNIYLLICDKVFYLSCLVIIFNSLDKYAGIEFFPLNNNFLDFSYALILGSGFILLQNKHKRIINDTAFKEITPKATNWLLVLLSKKLFGLPYSYIFFLMTICIVGFILRIFNLDYIQGSDLFNLSSAKALFDNGTFYYERNLQITYLISFMFKVFDTTLFYARLPLVIFGTISIFLIFILGNFINKKIALISCILLAISPMAIEESTLIREYSENLLIAITAYIFIFYITKYFSNYKIYLSQVLLLCGIIFTYSKLVNNYTLQLLVLIVAFSSIPGLFANLIKDKQYSKQIIRKYIVFVLIFLLLFFTTMHLFFAGFYLFGFEPYWFISFFSPFAPYPMQWFSYTTIPTLILVFIFLLPIVFSKDKFVLISFFSFFLILCLFTFKFENTLSYVPTRYLYIIFPFYILMFSSGIYVVTKLLADGILKKIILTLFFTTIFINPEAIIHATKHDLVRGWPTNDTRQPTSTGTRMDVSELLVTLKEMNILPTKKPIVLTDFNPSWLVLQPGSTIESKRYFSDNGNYKYDIGSNIYLENNYWGIYELEEQVKTSSSGIYITRSSDEFSKSSKFELANFNLVLSYKGFEVYTW